MLALPQVKMVEIKLAQGAKPENGGLLPKEKITREIADLRGIPMGQDCRSPNRFPECHDARSLLAFVARVRKLTGKPIGLKMVVGSIAEVEELCREIRRHGDGLDFIAVDGKEGDQAQPHWRWPTTSVCLSLRVLRRSMTPSGEKVSGTQ